MAYYDTVRTEADFLKMAKLNAASSFQRLRDSRIHWRTAASGWGIQQLLSSRVLCKRPQVKLPIFERFMESMNENELDPMIQNFIKGPKDLRTLRKQSDSQIMRTEESEYFGLLWSKLALLIRENVEKTAALERPRRDVQRNLLAQDSGPSQDPTPERSASEPSSTDSSHAPSSESFTIATKASENIAEDYTSSFLYHALRCVIDFSQPLDKTTPYLQVRLGRLSYTNGKNETRFEAIDDGGIEYRNEEPRQVILLEAKRYFQATFDNRKTVTDNVLGQLVGEALALRLSHAPSTFQHSKDDVISILAVKHLVKFFHFSMTNEFVQNFEHLDPLAKTEDDGSFLKIDSTEWFDLAKATGRSQFVSHLVASIKWADLVAEHQVSGGDNRPA